MPRITKVYTRTGDDGTTALGEGTRVGKDSLRIEAYGTVDELSSSIGTARSQGLDSVLDAALGAVQNDLFHLGSGLCFPEVDKEVRGVPQIEQRHIDMLEKLMDELSVGLPALENFILPGGCSGAALLHVARTVCRRAERRLVTLAGKEPVGEFAVRYLNRLSDALFVAARYENVAKGRSDVLWDSRK